MSRGAGAGEKEAAWRCALGTCDWVLRDCPGDGGEERPDLTRRDAM